MKALGENPYPFEIPSRSLAIIKGKRQLFTYSLDGVLSPIPDTSFEEIGASVWAHDFTSIGKVVVRTSTKLYELTESNELQVLGGPEQVQGPKFVTLAEMPASNAVVVFADQGLLLLGSDGSLTPLAGSEVVDVYQASTLINALYLSTRNELLFAARNGLFTVVDNRTSGDQVCY